MVNLWLRVWLQVGLWVGLLRQRRLGEPCRVVLELLILILVLLLLFGVHILGVLGLPPCRPTPQHAAHHQHDNGDQHEAANRTANSNADLCIFGHGMLGRAPVGRDAHVACARPALRVKGTWHMARVACKTRSCIPVGRKWAHPLLLCMVLLQQGRPPGCSTTSVRYVHGTTDTRLWVLDWHIRMAQHAATCTAATVARPRHTHRIAVALSPAAHSVLGHAAIAAHSLVIAAVTPRHDGGGAGGARVLWAHKSTCLGGRERRSGNACVSLCGSSAPVCNGTASTMKGCK